MANTNYNRPKRFYIIFKKSSMHRGQYCVVEASLQADAEIYADAYFQDEWDKVLSSGQWWQFKQSNRHLVGMEPKEVERI